MININNTLSIEAVTILHSVRSGITQSRSEMISSLKEIPFFSGTDFTGHTDDDLVKLIHDLKIVK